MEHTKNVSIGSFGFLYDVSGNTAPPECLEKCSDKSSLIYIVSGKGKCIIEGSEYHIREGSVLLIPQFSYFCLDFEEGRAFEYRTVEFPEEELFSDTVKVLKKIYTGAPEGVFYSPESVPPSFESLFEKLDSTESFSETEKGLFVKCVMTEIFILLSNAKSERQPRDEDALGIRVLKYINDNIHRNVSLEKIATRFFVSKFYLCRAFKAANGISVHSYINKKRIMYAKKLIESGETASSAAYKTGFGDYSAFYRAYIKILGKSPTQKEDIGYDGI